MRAAVALAPDVFAVVMATGIVSIAAAKHEYWWVSGTLGVLASLALVVLVALVALSVGAWDLRDPDVTLRLFTFMAACAVLDSRLTSHPVVARVLGAIALSAWLVLIVLSARNMSAWGWAALRDRVHGAWELASVGTSGLAIVTTQAARYSGHHLWLAVAVSAWVIAIGLYGVMTWLMLWRAVSERQDRDGFEPDSWILMGALAIATLAGDDIHHLAPGWLAGVVRTVTVVTWVAATLWIPPLIYFGLHRMNRRPEVLQLTGAWWTLVFPLGMYSVATHAMAGELGVASMRTVSLVFFWNALTAWLIVVVAGLLRLWQFRRGPNPHPQTG